MLYSTIFPLYCTLSTNHSRLAIHSYRRLYIIITSLCELLPYKSDHLTTTKVGYSAKRSAVMYGNYSVIKYHCMTNMLVRKKHVKLTWNLCSSSERHYLLIYCIQIFPDPGLLRNAHARGAREWADIHVCSITLLI